MSPAHRSTSSPTARGTTPRRGAASGARLRRVAAGGGLVLLASLLAPATGAGQPMSLAAAASAGTGGTVERVLRDDQITESSGLARSTRRRPVLFTHNDSGDLPRVFAVGKRGRTRGVLTLRGAQAVDWEDISSGPRHSLWVGDIGDNAGSRDHVDVYRIREPWRLGSRSVRATRYSFAYPGGPRDAEGLMVHPRTGRLFIVSKAQSGAAIYRAPRSLSTTRVNRLRRVADAPSLVTAAAFFPNGRRFVLGTYADARVHRRIGSRGWRLRLPSRPQGESLTVRRGGQVLVGSEGVSSQVHQVFVP